MIIFTKNLMCMSPHVLHTHVAIQNNPCNAHHAIAIAITLHMRCTHSTLNPDAFASGVHSGVDRSSCVVLVCHHGHA